MTVELVVKTAGVNSYSNLSGEEIVAAIARHGTIKEDNGKLVRYLMDHAHWSPLEFINYTFKIQTSRDIGRQMLRHTSLSAQEWSLRYSEPLGFEDIELRKEHPTNRQSSTEVFDPIINWDSIVGPYYNIKASIAIQDCIKQIEHLYKSLINAGVAKECARGILPGCTSSIMHFNGSLRSWLSFLNVRMDAHSQKEVQDIASAIGQALELELPTVFNKIQWKKGMFM